MSQIANAAKHPRITYRVAATTAPQVDSGSVDLITVAQALHWFDRDSLCAVVNRVLKPNGVLLAWCYNLLTISPDVHVVINEFYHNVVGPYWPPERRHTASQVATSYQTAC